MDSVFLKKLKVDEDWKDFLTNGVIAEIQQIEKNVIKKDFTPPEVKVLRFLEMPLHHVKIIILGQDPYPQAGVATGRSFEVGTLKSWNVPFKNISLKNILRALYQAYTGKTIKFNELKTKLDNEFPVLSPGKLFGHWEKEGVLLLNTSYTCETGKPGSHRKHWEEFSKQVLQYMYENKEDATWFLWGRHAMEATEHLKLKHKIVTHHPMMCYEGPGRDKDFLYGEINCFKEFIPKIDWTGYKLEKQLKSTGELF